MKYYESMNKKLLVEEKDAYKYALISLGTVPMLGNEFYGPSIRADREDFIKNFAGYDTVEEFKKDLVEWFYSGPWLEREYTEEDLNNMLYEIWWDGE